MVFFLEGTESGKVSNNQKEGQMAKVKHKLVSKSKRRHSYEVLKQYLFHGCAIFAVAQGSPLRRVLLLD